MKFIGSLKEILKSKSFRWSMLIGLGLALIMFGSNWMGLIHQGEKLTAYQLFDISFYYFTPLVSWAILTIVFNYFIGQSDYLNEYLKSKLLFLFVIALLLSPFIRVFDILLDYAIKNLIGMVSVSPFKILGDVWLVVLFSSPTAFFKIVLILAITYYFERKEKGSNTLTIRTGDGTFHVIKKQSIAYLQSDGNYLNVRVENEEYRTRNTLKSFESKLDERFFRIHKSTIINWNHIKQLKHWRNGEYLVVMLDDKPLTSSRSYKESIDEIKNLMIADFDVSNDPKSATVRPTLA